jgi:hypothetical protein
MESKLAVAHQKLDSLIMTIAKRNGVQGGFLRNELVAILATVLQIQSTKPDLLHMYFEYNGSFHGKPDVSDLLSKHSLENKLFTLLQFYRPDGKETNYVPNKECDSILLNFIMHRINKKEAQNQLSDYMPQIIAGSKENQRDPNRHVHNFRAAMFYMTESIWDTSAAAAGR